MAKDLYNFYLDKDIKKQAIDKLTRLTGDLPKGQLASLIRVMINMFIATPDEKINKDLISAIYAEYNYNTFNNKRSNL